jgi:hypothetical protein
MNAATDHKKMLVIGLQWPQPQATAAGQRMWQLLQGFRKAGYRITFASAAARHQYDARLESLGIEVQQIELNHPSFDRWLQSSHFDVVLFDRFVTE